jgi:hypothetical protein
MKNLLLLTLVFVLLAAQSVRAQDTTSTKPDKKECTAKDKKGSHGTCGKACKGKCKKGSTWSCWKEKGKMKEACEKSCKNPSGSKQ